MAAGLYPLPFLYLRTFIFVLMGKNIFFQPWKDKEGDTEKSNRKEMTWVT